MATVLSIGRGEKRDVQRHVCISSVVPLSLCFESDSKFRVNKRFRDFPAVLGFETKDKDTRRQLRGKDVWIRKQQNELTLLGHDKRHFMREVVHEVLQG